MLGDQSDDTVAPLSGALADELGDLDVLPAADRLRQHRIGDVADQYVLEGVFTLAGEAAAGARHQQVLLLQIGERPAEIEALLRGGRGQGALPEGLADD